MQQCGKVREADERSVSHPFGVSDLVFSPQYQRETEEHNERVIKMLQEQGDLPMEDPWEYVGSSGKPLLEDYQCTIPHCERITHKLTHLKDRFGYFVRVKIDLCNFLFGTNDYHSRCGACAKRAGIRREAFQTKYICKCSGCGVEIYRSQYTTEAKCFDCQSNRQ